MESAPSQHPQVGPVQTVIPTSARTSRWSLLGDLADGERTTIEEASATLRKARQSVPVAFGRRKSGRG